MNLKGGKCKKISTNIDEDNENAIVHAHFVRSSYIYLTQHVRIKYIVFNSPPINVLHVQFYMYMYDTLLTMETMHIKIYKKN